MTEPSLKFEQCHRLLGVVELAGDGGPGPVAGDVAADVDLVGRLGEAGTPLAWKAHNAVRTSDRSDCRARGGFGDYVRSLADDPVDAAASAGSA